jgi:hypothetical protein
MPGNAKTWLTRNTIIDSLSDEPNEYDLSDVNKVMKLQFGDNIWLARRSKRAKVCQPGSR